MRKNKIKHIKINISKKPKFKITKVSKNTIWEDKRVRWALGLGLVWLLLAVKPLTKEEIKDNALVSVAEAMAIAQEAPILQDFEATQTIELKVVENTPEVKIEPTIENKPVEEKKEVVQEIKVQKVENKDYTIEENKQIIREAARRHGVSEDLMLRLAKCESGFNEKATNKNGNGSIDRGLFQYNSIHKMPAEKLFDPYYSSDLAAQWIKNGRLGAWVCSKKI